MDIKQRSSRLRFFLGRFSEDSQIFLIRKLNHRLVIRSEGHTTDVITDLIIPLEKNKGEDKKPFFAFISYQVNKDRGFLLFE